MQCFHSGQIQVKCIRVVVEISDQVFGKLCRTLASVGAVATKDFSRFLFLLRVQ